MPSAASALKAFVGVAALVGAYLLRNLLLKDFSKNFLLFCEFVRAQGAVGVAIYIVALAFWIVFCLPCTIVEMVPGFLFGFKAGVVISCVGKNLGNLISLVLGQTLLRGWIKERTKQYTILEALDAAIKHDGFVMILLVRSVFLPMAVKNYGLAALGVSIPQNMLGAILSGLPFAICWSYVGSTAQDLVEIAEGRRSFSDLDLPPWAMGVGGLVTVGIFALTSLYVKRAFDAALKSVEERKNKAE